MKKLIMVGVLVVGAFVLSRWTGLDSYVGTLCGQARKVARDSVPTRFELERVRHQIAQMDGDIRGLINPIAERMADVTLLKRSIEETRRALAEQKQGLLTLTARVDENPTAEELRNRLHRDFGNFKLLEAKVTSQEKELAQKERALNSTRKQLEKLQDSKQKYELELARLEADQAALETAQVGTRIEIDNSRATDIASTLREIERRQIVQEKKLLLLTNQAGNDRETPQPVNEVSSQDIRNYLERGQTTPVSSKE